MRPATVLHRPNRTYQLPAQLLRVLNPKRNQGSIDIEPYQILVWKEPMLHSFTFPITRSLAFILFCTATV